MEETSGRGILIAGAGGHAKVVIEVARACGLTIGGLLDPRPDVQAILDVPVLGSDNRAGELYASGFRIAFVAIGRNDLRVKVGNQLREIGFHLATLLHPSAVISPSSTVGAGVLAAPNVVVNASARVGDYVILNTGSIVEHDCMVGEGSHLAPRSVLGGTCTLGKRVLFGIGAVARPESIIGDDAVIGAGSVVIGRIPPNAVCYGVPARARS